MDCLANHVLSAIHPDLPARVRQRPQRLVVDILNPVGIRRPLLLAGNDVHILGNLRAVRFQRQVVDVPTKRVLNLPANHEQAQNDVGRCDGGRNRNPVERGQQLEGKKEDVDPGNLRNGDGVGDGERGGQHTVGTHQDVVHDRHVVVSKRLLHGHGQLTVGDQLVRVGGEVTKDFEGEVAKRARCLLNHLARIGGGEANTNVLANCLEEAGWLEGLEGLIRLLLGGALGKGVKVGNEVGDVIVTGVRLEAEAVLESHREGDQEVQHSSGNTLAMELADRKYF